MMSSRFLIHAVLGLFLVSCSKDVTEIEVETISVGGSDPIRFIESIGDTLVIGGGQKNGQGFVAIADKSNMDFEYLKQDFKYPAYSIYWYDNRYWLGLGNAVYRVTTNLKQYDPYYFKESDWIGDLFRYPFRRTASVDGELFAIIGGQLSKGVVYHSSDTTKNWNPEHYNHEFRALEVTGDSISWTAWVGGNGALLRKRKGDSTWTRINIESMFIIDIHFDDEQNGICVTYDGDVFQSSNGGNVWKKVDSPKQTRFVNRMRRANGHYIVTANDGFIAHSTNGKQWNWYDLNIEEDLTDVWIDDDGCYITSNRQNIHHVLWTDLQN